MNDFIEYWVFGRGSNIVNFVAFVITLIGIGFTFKQVKKSKEAVLKVREDVRKINFVGELSKAISMMDEIRSLHREKKWKTLLDKYSDARGAIVNIRSTSFDLSEMDQIDLQSTLTELRVMEQEVEIYSQTKQSEPDIFQYNRIVSERIDKLRQIYAEVQNNIGR